MPIVLLVGFLMGVIIAFEIGLVAQQFGSVIFVVTASGRDAARTRPLMTAIVFSRRTGAAFAAQIGTENLNEEVNATSTFGLNFRAVHRSATAAGSALVVPLFAILADLVGDPANGYDHLRCRVPHFSTRLLRAITASESLIGIVKAIVFRLTIAAIGCQRGLATRAGATFVGLSTTSTSSRVSS